MKTAKYLLLSIIILLLFLMKYFSTALQTDKQPQAYIQKSDSTAKITTQDAVKRPASINTWRTYSDPVFNATFQYPPTWYLNPGMYGNTVTQDSWQVSINDPNYAHPNCRGDCPYFGIHFTVKNNPKNLSLIEVIEQDYYNMTGGTGDSSVLKVSDVTIANIEFKKVLGIPGGAVYYLYTSHYDKTYVVDPSAGILDDLNTAKVKANLAIFEQVISTFRFIK